MGEKLIYKNQDCVEFLKTLDDKSVDLICTDPPYYRVVNDEWDNQWFTIDQYYEWCEQWITELGRVAKWSCSFWLFGFPQQLTALMPVIERAGFNFRQQIVVNKGMQAVAGRTSDRLKMFPTATESIFFFHYEARDHIRDLLQTERKRLEWKGCDVNGYLGKATTGGGTFACIASEKKPREHRVYPTREDWTKLQEVMNLPDYSDLVYTFNLPRGLTDVWDDINFYDRKITKIHSTQKPVALMERLVLTSSNPGQKVLDIFGGSGSTAVACKMHERDFIGCELDEKYYQKSLERIKSTVPVDKLAQNLSNPLLDAL
jgi:adenine-specific DNA-methyltransferase